MATFRFIPKPASATGGIEDCTQLTLVANTSQSIAIGVRQIFSVTIQGASDANGSTGAHIRFGNSANGTVTAASTDFFLPAAQIPVEFDTGDEFDTIAFVSAGTPIVNVLRINRS